MNNVVRITINGILIVSSLVAGRLLGKIAIKYYDNKKNNNKNNNKI